MFQEVNSTIKLILNQKKETGGFVQKKKQEMPVFVHQKNECQIALDDVMSRVGFWMNRKAAQQPHAADLLPPGFSEVMRQHSCRMVEYTVLTRKRLMRRRWAAS